jgi:mannose-6-phosphate isomerase-like protein (cupin superfamily)
MGPDPVVVKLEPGAVGGAFSIIETTVTPGVPGPPPHVHTDGLHEVWYLLEGELDFHLGETTVRARAGSFAHVPPGIVHTFSNPGTETARFVGLFHPGAGLGMIEDLSSVIPAGPEPPDVERMMAVFAAHGVEVVGPS